MNNPIRIATFIGKWNGYGVETLVFNCYKNIDRTKIQFDFFVDETSDMNCIPFDSVKEMGGRIYLIPTLKHLPRYFKEVKRIIKSNNYLIAHAHINTLCVFPLFICKVAGVPIRIAHSHSTAGKCEFFKSLLKYMLRPFEKCFATHYGASSIYGGKWMFGKKCFEKYDMLYLPVARDLKSFLYNEETRLKKRNEMGLDNKFVVGHLGRFEPVKNHKFIVETFSEILKIEPNSELLLVGEGYLQDEVKNQVKELGIADKVEFLGKRSDISELLQAMDLFILPSYYEGISGAGIEAQAAGLPYLFADSVTEEAGIVPNLCFRLPVSDGAKYWAEVALSTRKIKRETTCKALEDAGFEISKAAENLQSYYLKIVSKANLR